MPRRGTSTDLFGQQTQSCSRRASYHARLDKQKGVPPLLLPNYHLQYHILYFNRQRLPAAPPLLFHLLSIYSQSESLQQPQNFIRCLRYLPNMIDYMYLLYSHKILAGRKIAGKRKVNTFYL